MTSTPTQMRAWVFSEAQIEPAMQRWLGTQKITAEEEQFVSGMVLAFLVSPAAASLRMTEYDPKEQVRPAPITD